MTITMKTEGTAATLHVEGWLYTQSSPDLGKAVKALPEETAALILDFKKLEYISSSGLREVVAAYKKMKDKNGTFSVIHVGNEVMDVFRLTGFDKKLDIRSAGEVIR